MRHYRNLKIASVIEEELGKFFLKDFDFDGALVTIVNIEVDEHLKDAIVSLSVLPLEKGPEVFMMVEAHRRELQFRLNRTMNIKPMPKLTFKIAEE